MAFSVTDPTPAAAVRSRNLRRAALATAAVSLAMLGAAWWATGELVDRAKNYLDVVLIQQSAKQRVVFTYDGVERDGLLAVRVKNPRFVGTTQDGEDYKFHAEQVGIALRGVDRFKVSVPNTVELIGTSGTILLLTQDGIPLHVQTNGPEGMPSMFEVDFPERTTLRILDAKQKRVASYTLQAQHLEFGVKRPDVDHFESWLKGSQVGLGEEDAPVSTARIGQLAIDGSLHQIEKLKYDIAQNFSMKDLTLKLPPAPGKAKKDEMLSVPLDFGWKSTARLSLFLDAVQTNGTEESAPTLQYLVEKLTLKDGYLRVNNLPLVKAKGELVATREDPQPIGEVAVTFGGFTALKNLLKVADDKTYLPMLEAAQKKLIDLGKKTSEDTVEVVVSRKANEIMKIGTVDYDMASADMLQAVMAATGANVYMDAPGIGKVGLGSTDKDAVGTFGTAEHPLMQHSSKPEGPVMVPIPEMPPEASPMPKKKEAPKAEAAPAEKP